MHGEPNHRVLNDIERIVLVTDRHESDPKRTGFDPFEERIEVGRLLQRFVLFGLAVDTAKRYNRPGARKILLHKH
jgi:hypothetical protein